MKPNRFGFSLIEVSVVLAILGAAMAMLLVALQTARESARRNQCLSNQRQLGLALHNALVAKGELPSLICGFKNKGTTGIFRELLPFLEVANLGQLPFAYEECTAPFHSHNDNLPLRCPSDGSVSGTNFRFSFGSSIFMIAHVPMSEPEANGAFLGLEKISLSSISDGLSNTIAISERPIGVEGDTSYARTLGVLQGWNNITSQEVASLSNLHSSIHYDFGGRSPVLGGLKHVGFNVLLTPNAPRQDFLFCAQPLPCAMCNVAMISARSLHAGGVNVTNLDGSVRFIANSISPSVWHALGTRDGGEVIPAFD